MTESEWLACAKPQEMLEALRDKPSDRQLGHSACAFCRAVRGALYLGPGPALVGAMLAALEAAASP